MSRCSVLSKDRFAARYLFGTRLSYFEPDYFTMYVVTSGMWTAHGTEIPFIWRCLHTEPEVLCRQSLMGPTSPHYQCKTGLPPTPICARHSKRIPWLKVSNPPKRPMRINRDVFPLSRSLVLRSSKSTKTASFPKQGLKLDFGLWSAIWIICECLWSKRTKQPVICRLAGFKRTSP